MASSRHTPGLEDEVEESIEFMEDEGGLANGAPTSQHGMTRHTRSHYDLHSKKAGHAAGRHAPAHAVLSRGPPRVPLQPRVSTPPCACATSGGMCGSGGPSAAAGWGGAGGRSCTCLSPTALAARARQAVAREAASIVSRVARASA